MSIFFALQSPAKIGAKEAELSDAVTVSAPGWFTRSDFQDWRQKEFVATWSPFGRWDEWSDVFLYYEITPEGHLIGGDTETLPEDIHDELERLLLNCGAHPHGVIWLKPT